MGGPGAAASRGLRAWKPDSRTATLTALAIADALGLFLAGMCIGAAVALTDLGRSAFAWGLIGFLLVLVTGGGIAALVALVAEPTEDQP